MLGGRTVRGATRPEGRTVRGASRPGVRAVIGLNNPGGANRPGGEMLNFGSSENWNFEAAEVWNLFYKGILDFFWTFGWWLQN